MTGSKTQSCPRLKMLLKLPLCFAHLFHVLIPSLAFKDHYVSLQKGLPGMKSKLSCLNGVGKETALAKNSRHTGFGHTRDDTKHCSATPVCGVNHSPPWTSGILEEHLPLSSTLNCSTCSRAWNQKQVRGDLIEKVCCGRVQDQTENIYLTVIKYLFKIEKPICWNAEALSFSCRVKEQLIIKYTFYELSTKLVMFSQSLAKHLYWKCCF